jgi:ABC-type amino acid transport substrate-binding protein
MKTPLLLALVLGLSAAGCQAVRAKPLRVGISPDAPPLAFEEGGEMKGLEAEMARTYGEDARVPVEFVRREFPRLINALIAGEVDVVMSGMSVTPGRARTVSFTEPYLQSGQRVLVRAADAAVAASAEEFVSTRLAVGYERGTTGEAFVKTRFYNATTIPFPDGAAGIAALRTSKIDAFVHDSPTVWAVIHGEGGADLAVLRGRLTQEDLAWAVRPWDGELRGKLNAALAKWREDGRLEEMVRRWLGERAAARVAE